MPSASAIRLQIESVLADKIPSALTPQAKAVRPVVATGIAALDIILNGGLPIGALTELVGPECSGKSTIAASYIAELSQANKVCAWIDVSNTFDPLAAAATGIDLSHLLWVRCGVVHAELPGLRQQFALPARYMAPTAVTKGLHGGGGGPHPRSEIKGIAHAVGGLLQTMTSPRYAESISRSHPHARPVEASNQAHPAKLNRPASAKPWPRIEQALRTADLLLQAGGFSAIVLDMGSLAPDAVSRIPLATWHRYRLASERTQSSMLLLTQHSCAKSSAELLLRLQPLTPLRGEATVFTGTRVQLEIARQRCVQEKSNLLTLKKPPQNTNTAHWSSHFSWAGQR